MIRAQVVRGLRRTAELTGLASRLNHTSLSRVVVRASCGLGERDRTTQLLTASIETLVGVADPTSPDPGNVEAYGSEVNAE